MIGGQPGWVGVLIGCLVFAAPIQGAESPEQLLATARDGNRAAIQSIRTMECRYERIPWANTSVEKAREYFFMPPSPGQFWRSGDSYRLIESSQYDGTTLEYVVRNGQILIIRRGGPLRRPSLALDIPKPVDGVGGAMWQYLLFSHWGWQRTSYYTLSEILQHRHELRFAERLAPPSNEIHAEISHDGVKRQEFWFDPKVNYLVRKCVWVPARDANLRWEHEVIEFAEPAPGVYVPTTIEHHCFVKGKQQAVIRTLITGLKVNHAMPASAMRIPGIKGLDCIDLTRDMQYKVDEDGNRVGPETSVVVARIAPGPSEHPSVWSPPQPSKPPTPWWVWVLIGSVAILVVGIALGIIRRRRQAAQM